MANGTLAVWSDIDAEAEDDYNAWYEREHMFERIEVPGIRRARHYRTVLGAPRFFTYFELDAPSVISGGVYLQQTNHSSPWTQRVLPHFRNVNRTVSRVVRRVGRGFGACAMTVRCALANGEDARLLAALADRVLPDAIQRPGIVAAQLWQVDREASLQPGQDRDLRPGDDDLSDLTIFIEATEVAPLENFAADPELISLLAAAETLSPPQVAIHQLLNGAETDEAPQI